LTYKIDNLLLQTGYLDCSHFFLESLGKPSILIVNAGFGSMGIAGIW
jgi:hypothetical protein